MRRAEHALEIHDRPTAPADRAASLRDIDRLNAWFGGHALALHHIKRVLAALPPAQPVTVVDVGTGSGGLAVRLVRWSRRAGRRLRVIALDLEASPQVTAAVRSFPEIWLVRGDALALPLRPGAVDLAVSSLTLHHLPPEVAVGALQEMASAARRGFVVVDLWRSRLALAAVWLTTRVLGCHWISRHDGPLSVRRSYSADEVRRLAARAGIGRLGVHTYPWLVRVVAVGSHPKGARAAR
jgi:phospholipid N-methyltransferase